MDRIIVKPQESTNILSDIASPLSTRVGFIGNPNPVFPVYSYRCLGVGGEGDNAKSGYYNELFLLDRRLAAEFPAAYLKLTTLPAPSYEESLIITEILERDFNRLAETDQTNFVEEIVCLLPKFKNTVIHGMEGKASDTGDKVEQVNLNNMRQMLEMLEQRVMICGWRRTLPFRVCR